MTKLRHIIVGIITLIYLMLFLSKVEISHGIFTVLLSIILLNQVIDEWNVYKETAKKIHLLIPITFLVIIIIFLVSYILF
ncbi:hypothetical protein EUAN_19930 [Andreesenia angusta]|uniref:Prokaryotic cytochrome C oxidase subunit IV n=1 Tax=Andreesenia angusta TaxID=39480 RepID=A0A1S1V4V7_9FIRM|nr:hypothetical protein EUAN_19930 [Andreesenia angusta]